MSVNPNTSNTSNPSDTSVSASAPGKLLLFGDHAVVYGHPCLVTAVDQRVTVSVEKNDQPVFQVDAPDLGINNYQKSLTDLGQWEIPKSVAFLEHLYQRFQQQHPTAAGVHVRTQSQFSAQFGFGSSSAVTVAFAKALTGLYGLALDNHQLFSLCYQAVIDVQGVGSGFDIAAAIWGGTIYYVTPAKVVEALPAQELSLVVGYTGIKADTPTLVKKLAVWRNAEPDKINGIFDQIELIVEAARVAMTAHDWPKVGELMNQNQALLRQLQVSSPELENLISAANGAGAFGAKLSGAGGGDCMIAVVDQAQRGVVEKAITAAGGTVLPVILHADGVK